MNSESAPQESAAPESPPAAQPTYQFETQKKPRRGGCLFLSFFLLSLLLVPVLFLLLLVSPGSWSQLSSGHDWEEVYVEDNSGTNKVVIVKVDGIISGLLTDSRGNSMVQSLKKQLDLAAEDDSVLGVLLLIDSPGGEVLASDEIYEAIESFQQDSSKIVVAYLSGLAASGGYYIASPCRWIVAHKLTITGSIGVIIHGYNYRGLMDKVGVQPMVFKSGRFKDMLSGDKKPDEILPESKQMIQDLVDEAFGRFKEVVERGRNQASGHGENPGKALAADWESYADGRILSGSQAHELGFIDELGNVDGAIDRMAALLELSGREDFDLIQYQLPFQLGNIFQLLGQTEQRAVEIDLGIDLPRLRSGRLYFLPPNYLE